MIIEGEDRPDGLVMVNVRGMARTACETSFNEFIVKHNLRTWGLLINGSFVDGTLRAVSVAPSGKASPEIVIEAGLDAGNAITNVLEQHLEKFFNTETIGKLD
jgi:hypothetical protein